jgi:hypothetical protein
VDIVCIGQQPGHRTGRRGDGNQRDEQKLQIDDVCQVLVTSWHRGSAP